MTPCTAGNAECTADGTGYYVCGPDAGVNTYGGRIPCEAGNACSGGACSGSCTTPEVMILFDRSSSMGGARYYDAAGAVSNFVWDEQRYVEFGLQVFPSSGACAVGNPVPMALYNWNAVEAGLIAPTGDAQTPIAAALDSLRYDYGDPSEAQYAILISDGTESATCGSSGDAAVTTAGELARMGVDTFVIAFSSEADTGLLDRIASAGRTGTAYRVSTAVQLTAALYDIVGSTRACACGDGVRQTGEACDDGNRADFDYCSADCNYSTGYCGDGYLQSSKEVCDDGNQKDGDYCSANCQTVTGRCGDGIKQTNEACDDGNTLAGDYCAANCKTAYGSCGDGVVQSFEACDDGNNAAGDYCAADCKSVTGHCGDGTTQINEVCDDGHNTACGACDATCTGTGTGSTCGDGFVCPDTEACDDGNTTACGPCNETCTGAGSGYTCGDGTVCPDTEYCDDGHATACGTCNATCTGAGTGSTCGDGTVCPDTEYCDDGHATACGACNATCTGAGTGSVCGDSTVCADTEVCDDGNTSTGDYCAATCQSVTGRCGDSTLQTNEACDDGNTSSGDYCAADCKSVTGRCGDGITQTNEACEDGNTSSGDYCAPDCKSVTGRCGDSTLQTNEACDDGNTLAGDYCAADCKSVTGSCGDGITQTNEACDDGHNTACGSCDATCTGAGIGSTCGDGTVCPDTESCDDGFTTACGSCNATCSGPGTGSTCGDGTVCPDTESCDDGHATACGACNATCTGAGSGSVCGDSVVCEDTEVCDDGNTLAGDYCAPSCQSVTGSCGDAAVQTNEACDDGNTIAGDYCSADCKSMTGSCGDGIRQTNEVCDLPIPSLCASCAAHPAIVCGGNFTCAVRDSGIMKCWGSNGNGQLGLGDTANRGDAPGEMGSSLPATSLGSSRAALTISAGENHTCALLDDGSVKCWGFNGYGGLGLGDTADRGDASGEMADALPAVSLGIGRTARAVAASYLHTCALLDDRSLKCWGSNSSGMLGLGDTANRGDGIGKMGDSLPPVDLGTGRTAVAIGAGRWSSHTCAILDDRSLKCWGSNSSGQLGLGDVANRGDQSLEMGDYLLAVALGTGRTAVAVALGMVHTCALLDNGSVKCWGDNFYGHLGLGDYQNRGDGRREMGDALPVVSLGNGRTAVAIGAGSFHTCALLDDGSVKCWGHNADGRLGVGDFRDRGGALGDMGDALPAVNLGTGRTAVAISVGDAHACALLDDGSVKCWGDALSGQLGLGDTGDRGDSLGEMGDNLPTVNIWVP